MNIEQTNNLYENWIKKPEMIYIFKKLNRIPLFNRNRNIIYIAMIEVIYNNINKNLHLLTTDNQQLKFYKNMLNKIYINLYQIYDILYTIYVILYVLYFILYNVYLCSLYSILYTLYFI